MHYFNKFVTATFSTHGYLLLCFVIPAIFFYRSLFGGQVSLPADFIVGVYEPWLSSHFEGYPAGIPVKNPIMADVVSFTYPMQTLVAREIASGHLPLWNPYILGGSPLLANFQSAPFAITNLVYLFFSEVVAWNVKLYLAHVLCMVTFCLLMRSFSLSKRASLIGATLYAFTGFTVIWSQWSAHTLAASFIPAIIYFIKKYGETKSLRAGGMISLMLAFQIFSGYPQLTIYTVGVIILSILFFSNWQKHIISTATHYAFFLALGLLFASIQLVPGLELLKLSQRSTELHPFEWAFLPLSKLITFVIPDYFGNHVTANYWGPQDYTSNTGFVGMIAVFLMGIVSSSKKTKAFYFFLCIAVYGVVLSFPTTLSLILWKSGVLGFNAASAHRAMVMWSLGASGLAALGFDALLHKSVSYQRVIRLIFLSSIAIAGIVFVALYNRFVSHDLHYTTALRNMVLPVALFLSVSTFTVLFLRKIISEAIFYVVVLLFVVIELFSFGWKFTPFTPKQFLYPDTGITKELNAPWVTRTTGNTVIPVNFRMSYGISALEGYDAVYPARAAQYISSLNALSSTSRVSGRYALVDDIHSALVPLASVNSIITSNPSEFDPLRYKTVLTENKTTILEDSFALPSAYFVQKTLYKKTADVIETLLSKDFDQQNSAVIEGNLPQGNCVSGQVISNVSLFGERTIEVQTNGGCVLVVTDSFYPGWIASIDGTQTKIYAANYLFRAIYVPDGYHRVRFVYRPDSFLVGSIITFLSGVVIFMLVLRKHKKSS